MTNIPSSYKGYTLMDSDNKKFNFFSVGVEKQISQGSSVDLNSPEQTTPVKTEILAKPKYDTYVYSN